MPRSPRIPFAPPVGLAVLALLALLTACGGSPAVDLHPREPRVPEDEGWVAPAAPIAMGLTPEQQEEARLAARAKLLRFRERTDGEGHPMDTFGEAGASALIEQFEGAWFLAGIQFPGRTRPVIGLEGAALIVKDHAQLLIVGVGQGRILQETVFQAASYRIRPDISGHVALVPEGGFSNLGAVIRMVEEEDGSLDPTLDPKPPGLRGRPDPLPSDLGERALKGMTPGIEGSRSGIEGMKVQLYGRDRMRWIREENYWIELERMPTDRLVAERQRAFLERFDANDPDGSRARTDLPITRAAEEQRRRKRDLQGHWRVVELRNKERDPTQESIGGGFFTFYDGLLLYQLTRPVAFFSGRESQGFQVGSRRYALTSSHELLYEENFGVLSVAGFTSNRLRRLPRGQRTKVEIVFETEDRVRLSHDLDDYLVLQRIARPRWAEEELRTEKAEAEQAAREALERGPVTTPPPPTLELSPRKRPTGG